MAAGRALTVFCVVALLVAASADFPEEDDVLVLGDSNLDDALAEHDTLLVEFYAPWCGHCKKLAPEYARAAKKLKEDGYRIAKVDATENSAVAGKYEVQGYPTLKFFRAGKATEYNGGRTESEIVNWVRKKSGPAARTLASVADADKLKDSADVSVIGVFDSEDSNEAKQFLRVAAQNDDAPFGITTSSDVASELGVKAPAVVLFKNFDEGRNEFSGSFNEEELSAFVSSNSLPLVIPFSQDTAPKIFGGAIKTHLLVFADESDSALAEEIKTVAREVKGRMLAVTVDKSQERVTGYFGITKADFPTAVVVNMPEGSNLKKYLLGHSDITAAALSKFAQDYFDGNLKPHLKSAKPPASNDEGVKVIVGTTFEEIALDETKDVLVEFYAPWCGHCKALAPKYDELAEKLSGVEHITIAKMDATANEVDHPGVDVRGFPTIKFFKAGDKENVVDYDGEREVDGFISFLQKHSSQDFSLDGDDGGEL